MRRMTAIGAAATLALALALAPASALAQEGSSDEMSGADTMVGSMVPHPSHIHAGDCAMPGEVVAPLSEVGAVGNEAQGAESHVHADVGLSTVELPLEAILADDHSIMVHASADDMGTILACGAIGGHDVDGSFLVGLGPVGASGYSGLAWLTDNGDGTTDVQVAISHSGAVESMGMDDATSMDDGMSAGDDKSADDMGDDDMGDESMGGESMDEEESDS